MLILLCTISVSVSPFQLARVLMYLVICLVESMVYTEFARKFIKGLYTVLNCKKSAIRQTF